MRKGSETDMPAQSVSISRRTSACGCTPRYMVSSEPMLIRAKEPQSYSNQYHNEKATQAIAAKNRRTEPTGSKRTDPTVRARQARRAFAASANTHVQSNTITSGKQYFGLPLETSTNSIAIAENTNGRDLPYYSTICTFGNESLSTGLRESSSLCVTQLMESSTSETSCRGSFWI